MLFRNDVSQFKESRLKNCIDTSAKSDLFTDLDTVDHIEFDVMVGDEGFHLSWQMFLKAFHIPWAVQQECTAVNQFLYHVVFVDIGRIVACYKVCLFDQVCGFDRALTETQVRHCNTAGFLRVVIKICLSVHICVVTDDLDGVLVCSNSTVSS